MPYRLIAAALILLGLSLPASAVNINRLPDQALAAAAARLKQRDYRGARDAALRSGDKGIKAFVVGISSAKLELWDDAAVHLGVAADAFPILADYALYYRGVSLAKLGRNDDALTALMRVMKEHPSSRLVRPSLILYADTLLAAGFPKEALETYSNFIERYPSGNDSLLALLGTALCREKLGDPAAAAEVLRGIWINYPASSVAPKAAAELNNLSAAGTRVQPYQSSELFKRGSILYDLGRYSEAAESLSELPLTREPEAFAAKVRLKTGQALFKARRYREAETILRTVAAGTGSAEASLLLGRVLEKSGHSEEAYSLYLRLADSSSAAVADEALLAAAYLKRYQRKWDQALPLFQRYLAGHQDPQKQGKVLWETAWGYYQRHNYDEASAQLKKLAQLSDYRDKALYWLGKSLLASGDQKGAEAQWGTLTTEYPYSYYTLLCNKGSLTCELPAPPKSLADTLPMPSGFEREKMLIMLGLYEEAAKELSARKTRNGLGIARLYLEMENYNGALHALKQEASRKDGTAIWGVNYPLAFRDEVEKNAAQNGIPESLVYAVMRAESSYLTSARSPVGAVGLMQIMPATAEKISKGGSAKLTQPELNIRLGTKHLKYLLVQSNGNIPMAVAAYNAGSGNLKRWQNSFGELPQDEFTENIPFAETREYVKKVLSVMALYQRLYRLPAAKF